MKVTVTAARSRRGPTTERSGGCRVAPRACIVAAPAGVIASV
jgi:hypothetical protein